MILPDYSGTKFGNKNIHISLVEIVFVKKLANQTTHFFNGI